MKEAHLAELCADCSSTVVKSSPQIHSRQGHKPIATAPEMLRRVYVTKRRKKKEKQRRKKIRRQKRSRAATFNQVSLMPHVMVRDATLAGVTQYTPTLTVSFITSHR
ncbi:hypothetical protein E2C01_001526 [Portunus trituberculatus]|uniref:Uncharacterized protein n=1 Tax=Portunus trituberculatus TaxID=210409 RepID=A0A5B7CHI3_PORTR|nr:hypothetical protein [Portunus trituberculatus]